MIIRLISSYYSRVFFGIGEVQLRLQIFRSWHSPLPSEMTLSGLNSQAWQGVGVVASARKLIGSTNPLQAEPGTIRGDLAVQTGR